MKVPKNNENTKKKKKHGKSQNYNSGRHLRSICFTIGHLFNILLFALSSLWSLMYTLGRVESWCEIQIPIWTLVHCCVFTLFLFLIFVQQMNILQ